MDVNLIREKIQKFTWPQITHGDECKNSSKNLQPRRLGVKIHQKIYGPAEYP